MPRRSLELLVDRTFGPFFAGKLLYTVGMWVHNIASAIVVFQLTGSALLVGMVSVAQFVPQIVLTPWSGARADRRDRRRQLVVGRLFSAASSAALVAWTITVGLDGTTGALAVIIAALGVGIGLALGGPALNAVLPALVRPNELPVAVALNSMPFTVGRTGGPALGALLVATAGPAAAFGVTAATNLVFAVMIALITIREIERPTPTDGTFRAALRHLRVDPALGALLVGVAAIGIGADPVITLTPAIAATFDAGPSLVGILASAFGVGAGLTFFVLGRARARLGMARLGTGGLLLLAAGMISLAVSPMPAIAILALGVGGAGMTLSVTSLTTLVQERVPEELRGRLMALWAIAFLGSRPLAAATTGALTDAVSVDFALLVVGAVLTAGARIARPSRIARQPGLP